MAGRFGPEVLIGAGDAPLRNMPYEVRAAQSSGLGALVTLYTDSTGATPINQSSSPQSTDARGNYGGWADVGYVDIYVPSTGVTIRSIAVVDPTASGGGATPDATSSVKGKLQLQGDLAGSGSTAATPIISSGAVTNAKVSASAGLAHSKMESDARARVNHTGTQVASTISDFSAAVDARVTVHSRVAQLNVIDYGAVADGRYAIQLQMTSGSNILSSVAGGSTPAAPFTASMVGKRIVVSQVGAAGVPLVTTVSQYDSPTQVRLTANASTTVTGCGASWGTDNGAAFLAAFNALVPLGGGEVLVDGSFAISSSMDVFSSLAAQAVPAVVKVRGAGSGSRIILNAAQGGSAARPFTFYQGMSVTFEDVVFVGTPGVQTDVDWVVRTLSVKQVTLRNCHFFGISTANTMLSSSSGDLVLEQVGFWGTVAIGAPLVGVDNWLGLTARDVHFLDYGDLDNIHHGKTIQASTGLQAMFNVGTMNPSASTLGGRGILLDNVRADEGALTLLTVNPLSGRVRFVRVRHAMANVMSQTGGVGLSVSKVDRLVVEDSWLGYTVQQHDAISLLDVAVADLIGVVCDTAAASANTIRADAACGTLNVRECTYLNLVSSATVTNVIKNGRDASVVVALPTATASYVAAIGDVGGVKPMNVAGANTFTIPPRSSVAFPVGAVLSVYQLGAGQTTLTAGSGVTFEGGAYKTAAQGAVVTAWQRAADVWVVSGNTVA